MAVCLAFFGSKVVKTMLQRCCCCCCWLLLHTLTTVVLPNTYSPAVRAQRLGSCAA